MDEPAFTDADGNEWTVTWGHMSGWAVNRDGTVTHFHEEDGEREEWTEPLWSSPVRNVFGDWVWDLIDAHIDPRGEPEAHDPAS